MKTDVEAQLWAYIEKIRPKFSHAEDLLWNILQVEPFSRFKVRRQYVIASYTVNFYCPKLKLVIEIDSGTHSTAHNLQRMTFFNHAGLKTVRYRSDDILNRTEVVVRGLMNVYAELSTAPVTSS